MLSKLVIGAVGVAAGYLWAMYIVAWTALNKPEKLRKLIDKTQEQMKEQRERKAAAVRQAAEGLWTRFPEIRPEGRAAWNPTHPTDPGSR
jgi:uncharacterized membrane protein YccC